MNYFIISLFHFFFFSFVFAQKKASHILNQYPETINDEYSGQIYRGENCLHIAIVNKGTFRKRGEEKESVMYVRVRDKQKEKKENNSISSHFSFKT